MRKNKREYFNNLDEKNVCDNKKVLESSYAIIIQKKIWNEKMTIVGGGKIIKKL